MNVGDKIVMVDEDYYKELEARSLFLDALEEADVQTWEGFNKAVKIWNKKRKELFK